MKLLGNQLMKNSEQSNDVIGLWFLSFLFHPSIFFLSTLLTLILIVWVKNKLNKNCIQHLLNFPFYQFFRCHIFWNWSTYMEYRHWNLGLHISKLSRSIWRIRRFNFVCDTNWSAVKFKCSSPFSFYNKVIIILSGIFYIFLYFK